MAVPDRGDVRREVEIIQGIVEDYNSLGELELKRVHETYCSFLDDVNTELEACEALIDANDADQAVQRAERQKLLEIIATLESVDDEGWNEYLEDHSMKPAPSLRLGAAERLIQCFGPVRQREPLMRELRWHALAGSPLRLRLGVMYRIRASDEQPEAWDSDIADFEAARLSEIERELEASSAAQDASRLNGLCRELSAKNWIRKPDREMLKKARHEFQKCEARRARRRIPKIMEQLRNAESAGESQIDEGRRLMQRLENELTRARYPSDAKEFEQAREAVEWIVDVNSREQQEADYQFLLGEMDQLLNQFVGMKSREERKDARDRLKQLEYNLSNYDEGVPEDTANRLYSIYDDVEREERRAHALRLTLVSLAVVVTGALLAAGFYYRSQQNVLNEHVANLTALVEREDFSATDTYVATLEPDVLDEPPIVLLLELHRTAVEKEEERLASLQSRLASVEGLRTEAQTLADLAALNPQLDEMEVMCRYENELNDVDALRNRITASKDDLQKQIDERFSADLERLNSDYTETAADDLDALNELVSSYTALEGRPEVSPGVRVTASAPKQTVVARIALLREERSQARKLDEITRTVGSWPDYEAALGQFAQEFPQSSHGLQIARVLDQESELWAMIETQNVFVTKWSTFDFSRLTPDVARALVAEGREFRAAVPDFAGGRELEHLLTYLESVSKRKDSSGGKLIDPILEILTESDEVSALFMVMTKEGDRFYSDEEPRSLGNAVQIKQFTDADTKVPKLHYLKDIMPPPREGVRDNWKAPQTIFAIEATATLTRMNDSEWEDRTLGLLDKLARDERMEPIIKFQLLARMLPPVVEGSSILADALKAHVEEVEALRLGSNLNWYNPEDVPTQKARRLAERFFQGTPEFGGEILQNAAAKRVSLLKTDFGTVWEWCAWVYKDTETQRWNVAAPKPFGAADTADLFIANSTSGELRLTKIGAVNKGAVELNAAGATAFLVEGRPVFRVHTP